MFRRKKTHTQWWGGKQRYWLIIQKVAVIILKQTRKEGELFPPNKTYKF